MLHKWERVATGSGGDALQIGVLQKSLHRVLNSDAAREWLLSRSARYERQLAVECDYQKTAPDALEPESINPANMMSSVAFSYVVTPESKAARSFESSANAQNDHSARRASAAKSDGSAKMRDSSSSNSSLKSTQRLKPMETLLVPNSMVDGSKILGSFYMKAPHAVFPIPAGVIPAYVRRFVVDLAAEDGALVLILLTWYSNMQSVVEIRRIDRFGEYTGLYLWFAECEVGRVPDTLIAKAYFTDSQRKNCTFCSLRELAQCECPVEFRRRSGHRPLLPPRGAVAWSCWAGQLCQSRSTLTPMTIKIFDPQGTLCRSVNVYTSMHFLSKDHPTLLRLRREYTSFVMGNYADLLRGNLSSSVGMPGSSHRISLKSLTDNCKDAHKRRDHSFVLDHSSSASHSHNQRLGAAPSSDGGERSHRMPSAGTNARDCGEAESQLCALLRAKEEPGVHNFTSHQHSSQALERTISFAVHAQSAASVQDEHFKGHSKTNADEALKHPVESTVPSKRKAKTVGHTGLGGSARNSQAALMIASGGNSFNQQGLIGVEHVAPKSDARPEGPCLCRVCSAEFVTRSDALEHIFEEHVKLPDNNCPVCARSFTTLSNTRQHIRLVHLDKRPYKCPECSAAFKISSKLRRHVNNVHRDRAGALLRSHPDGGLSKKSLDFDASDGGHGAVSALPMPCRKRSHLESAPNISR